MERRSARSIPQFELDQRRAQFREQDQRQEWLYFRHRLLSEIGIEIPGVGTEKDFVKNAQSKGFKTGIHLGLEAREWLMEAYSDGAFNRLRNSEQTGSKDKKRDKAFTSFFYSVFTSARDAQVAEIMGYKGQEFPSRLKRNFFQDLYEMSSQELKDRVDFKKIDFKKVGVKYKFPPRTQEHQFNLSASRGGYLREIKGLIEQGIVDDAEIGRILSLDRVTLGRSLKYFRDNGFIPKTQNSRFRELASTLNSDLDTTTLGNLPLEMVSESFVKNHPDNFVSMTDLAQQAGLVFSPRENDVLSSALESNGVRVVEARHTTGRKSKYIVAQERDRALQIISSSEDFHFYKPITSRVQIAGPEAPMPNYREMKGNYVGIFEILRKANHLRSVLKSSPVQVIALPGVGFVIKKTDIPVFTDWLEGLSAVKQAERMIESSQEQVVFSAS